MLFRNRKYIIILFISCLSINLYAYNDIPVPDKLSKLDGFIGIRLQKSQSKAISQKEDCRWVFPENLGNDNVKELNFIFQLLINKEIDNDVGCRPIVYDLASHLVYLGTVKGNKNIARGLLSGAYRKYFDGAILENYFWDMQLPIILNSDNVNDILKELDKDTINKIAFDFCDEYFEQWYSKEEKQLYLKAFKRKGLTRIINQINKQCCGSYKKVDESHK